LGARLSTAGREDRGEGYLVVLVAGEGGWRSTAAAAAGPVVGGLGEFRTYGDEKRQRQQAV